MYKKEGPLGKPKADIFCQTWLYYAVYAILLRNRCPQYHLSSSALRNSLSFLQTLSHSHSYYSLSKKNNLSPPLIHKNTLSLSATLTHINNLSLSFSLSVSITHINTLSLSHSVSLSNLVPAQSRVGV